MTRAISITTSGDVTEVTLSTPPTLELQSLVGGDIECVPLHSGDTLYLNEEGKLQRSVVVNAIATRLTRGIVADDDLIVGDVVIVGPADDEGYDTDARMSLTDVAAR